VLGTVTEEAAQAVRLVTASVLRAADGANGQSAAAGDTAQSVEQLLVAIDQVARGAQAQAHDVSAATADAEEMAGGVDRVAGVAREGGSLWPGQPRDGRARRGQPSVGRWPA